MKVFIKNITAYKTIPQGNIEEDSIEWNITIINDEIVICNHSTYPYLFYEGEIEIKPFISAGITLDFGLPIFYIENKANFTLNDVIIFYADYGSYITDKDDVIRIFYFEKIKPSENLTSKDGKSIDKGTAIEKIYIRCLKEGLFGDEINHLLENWIDYWFSPSNIGIQNRVIFFIPEQIYNQILPISIQPKPDVIKRVGIFTITDIPLISSYQADNLTLKVEIDKTNLSINESLNISVVLQNKGRSRIELSFPDSQKGDFSILDSQGNEVYRWSDGKAFIQIITNLSINPGENITILSEQWTPSATGNYTIQAWLKTTPRIYSEPISIKVG